MSSKTTIYIDDTGIRLLVMNGNIPKAWGNVLLQEKLIEGGIVNDAAKLGDELTQLVKKQPLPSRNVTVGISAVNCLTRQLTMPAMPKNMLAEAVNHEAKRLLPIPLEELYLSWQIVPSAPGKTVVILVALRRSSVDRLLQAFKFAKLKVQNLTIKPLAMARLITDKNALLVDVQSSEFDVVIISDGIPQPIRSVSFPSPELNWQEKSKIITDEIDRTIKFYNTNNPDKPLDPDMVMYASGDLIKQSKLCNLLSKQFGFKIEPLNITPMPEADFQPNYFAVNVGLAVKQQTLGSEINRLNLLPEIYRPNQIKWTRALTIPGIAIFAGVIVVLAFMVNSASRNVVSARNQLNTANQTLQEKQIEKLKLNKDIKNLQAELDTLNSSQNGYQIFTDTLTKQADLTNTDLETAITNLPDAIALTSLSLDDKTLEVNGYTLDETVVFDYARVMESTGYFTQAVVSDIKLKQDEGTHSCVITLYK
jgi:type IV pilus assembly protein PilM